MPINTPLVHSQVIFKFFGKGENSLSTIINILNVGRFLGCIHKTYVAGFLNKKNVMYLGVSWFFMFFKSNYQALHVVDFNVIKSINYDNHQVSAPSYLCVYLTTAIYRTYSLQQQCWPLTGIKPGTLSSAVTARPCCFM